MATKAEVRQRVGEDLGLVPVGQALENQDQTRIDATFSEMYERLKERGIATFPAAGPVPTKLVPSFCLLMASHLLTSYSVPESRYLRISTEAGPSGVLALANLALLATPEYEPDSFADDF
jgi:hypothetical protein